MRIPNQILEKLGQYQPDTISDETLLKIAYTALDLVEPVYFRYPTVQGSEKIGERVLAYELYHVLRLLFQECSYLHITGEPIKGPGVIPTFNQTIIPDIVVHQYGSNNNNTIAIEIKTATNTGAGAILDDLKSLEKMLVGLSYAYGVFICANFDCLNRIKNSFLYKRKIKKILKKHENLMIWNVIHERDQHNQIINKRIKTINYKNV